MLPEWRLGDARSFSGLWMMPRPRKQQTYATDSLTETSEEMRAKGMDYLVAAMSEDDTDVAETLRRKAHVAFEMASLLERRGAMPTEH
jgi:hypothetical protein